MYKKLPIVIFVRLPCNGKQNTLQNRGVLRRVFRTSECPRTMPALVGTKSSPGRRCFRSTASTGTPTGACSGSISHTSGNRLAVREDKKQVTRMHANLLGSQTVNLLFSLLLTVTSKSHRVWVEEPLLGITADHGVVTTAAFPHLLLATHLRSLPCCWYCVSEASYSADITEMLQGATNQEKHWPSSLLYMWKWVTHPV